MSLIDRLDALKAQADTLPFDEFLAELKVLHLEERTEVNANWTLIARAKAQHVSERALAKERLIDAKARRTEAEHHIQDAQRKLDAAHREVDAVLAEMVATDLQISKLAKDIEDEYLALAKHRDRPVYDYFAQIMRAHPSPAPKPVELPAEVVGEVAEEAAEA
jgi:hypothetical protein